MKKLIFIFACLSLVFIACKKEHKTTGIIGDDYGCINRKMTTAQDTTVALSDYIFARQLFQSSNIDQSDLKMESVRYDTIINFNNQIQHQVIVMEQQYINNLPILNVEAKYTFNNGAYDYFSGKLISSCNLDTIPTLRLTQVRGRYVAALIASNSPAYLTAYKDSCLIAEFGYYDINTGSSNKTVNIVKAWHVYPVNNGGLPEAYIKDDGTLLLFFNGIIIF